MNKWTNEWMNAAFLSTVLGSCIIPSASEPVEGPFRTGRVSFSTYCHSWFISQIKLLASLSRWPDDLGCHVFIQAKWLVLWNISIYTKGLPPEKRKNSSSWVTLLSSRASPLTLVKTLPGILMSTQSIWRCCSIWTIKKTAQLVNTAAPEHATLKHSCMIKCWLIKLERI